MSDPYPYLFQDVDQFVKSLWHLNRKWFRVRFHVKESELRKIFDIQLKISRDLTAIRQILTDAERGGGNHA